MPPGSCLATGRRRSLNGVRSRKLILVAAVGLLSLASSAAASTALRTDPGGAFLPGPAITLTNTANDLVTFSVANIGSFNCTGASFDATVPSSISSTVLPAVLTGFTLTTCSNLFLGFRYSGCHLTSSAGATLSGGDTGGTLTFNDLLMRCNILGTPKGCDWTAATATGTWTNATGAIAFLGVPITHVNGGVDDMGALCGSTGALSWTFTHIVRGGTGNTVTLGTI